MALSSSLLLSAVLAFASVSAAANRDSVLHLLTFVANVRPPPNADSEFMHGRDRGWELIPAAELAAEKINEIGLQGGYRIAILPADTNSCEDASVNEALISYVRYAVNSVDHNVAATIGLTCPSVTEIVSMVANLPGIKSPVISSGINSPGLVEDTLFHIVSGTSARNDALIALMPKLGWERIGLIRDGSIPLYSETGIDFAEKATENENITLAFNSELHADASDNVQEAMTDLLQAGSKINYVSVSDSQAAEILCESFKKGLSSNGDGYLWILHDHPLEEFESGTEFCNGSDLIREMEGGFILLSRLMPEESTIGQQLLISGQTYMEYVDEYNARVSNGSSERVSEETQGHANALHDSVWAFALALNASLINGDLQEEDLQLYGLSDASKLTNALTEKLLSGSVDFFGALGNVSFNEERKGRTLVKIYQVQNGLQVLVALYDPLNGNISFELLDPLLDGKISDSFERQVSTAPLGLAITVIIIVVLLIVAAISVLVLFIKYWMSPEIKATAPILSMAMMAGCFMLFLSTIFISIRQFVSGTAYSAMCNLDEWFAIIGIQLIFSPLLLRLLRVYRIFTHFHTGKMGKLWTDQFLLLGVILMLPFTLVILLIWVVVDPLERSTSEQFNSVARPPVYLVTQQCSCNLLSVWLSLLFTFVGVIIILVLILAVLTRKVKIESFKDTKKVNSYIFITAIVIGVFLPLVRILSLTGFTTEPYIFQSLCFATIALLCILFLFIPKIWTTVFPQLSSETSSSNKDSIIDSYPGLRRLSNMVPFRPSLQPRHPSANRPSGNTSSIDYKVSLAQITE